MKETIIKVFKTILNVEESVINEDTVISSIEGFDSLQFVMLISELEETYSISIPVDVALKAKTVGDLISCAEKK